MELYGLASSNKLNNTITVSEDVSVSVMWVDRSKMIIVACLIPRPIYMYSSALVE